MEREVLRERERGGRERGEVDRGEEGRRIKLYTVLRTEHLKLSKLG